MKHVIAPIILITAMIASCWSPVKHDGAEGFLMVEPNADLTVYGTCEGVRDSTLMLFVSDNGDTMILSLKHAVMCGAPEVDCQLALMLDTKGELAKLINITALMGTWVEADPIDEGYETGISLLEGGAATSINSRVHNYTNWSIYNGQLLMTSQNDIGGILGEDIIDTFEIIKLQADSLVMAGSGYNLRFSHPSQADELDDSVEPDSMDYMKMLLEY